MKCKVGVLVLVPVCALCTSAQAASASSKEPDVQMWDADAGAATYVHLGKAGPSMSHNRL